METPTLKLVLSKDEEITINPALLKYIGFFENAYKEEGYTTFVPTKEVPLSASLWRLILSLLKAHETTTPETRIGLAESQALRKYTLSELYSLLRAFDFYDIPVLMDIVMDEIVVKSLQEDNNKEYTKTRAALLARYRKEIKTHELVEMIDKRYLPRVTSILASAAHHSLVVTQQGLMGKVNRFLPHPEFIKAMDGWNELPVQGVISVWSGPRHLMILTKHGLYATGDNTYGQLGIGDVPSTDQLVLVKLPQVLQVSCGDNHTLFLTTRGVYASGENTSGELGIGTTNDAKEPELVAIQDEIVSVACGNAYSLLLSKGGSVYLCGKSIVEAPIPNGLAVDDVLTPTRLSLPDGAGRIVSIAAGPQHAILVNTGGSVFVFGDNGMGQLGLRHSEHVDKITRNPNFKTMIDTAVACDKRSFFIDGRGTLYGLGENSDKAISDFGIIVTTPMKLAPSVISVACNETEIIVLKGSGLYTLRATELVKEDIVISSETYRPLGTEVNNNNDLGKYANLCCYQCGNRGTTLGFHQPLRRIFCSQSCLSTFKTF